MCCVLWRGARDIKNVLQLNCRLQVLVGDSYRLSQIQTSFTARDFLKCFLVDFALRDKSRVAARQVNAGVD